ncbi:oligopeptide transporter [Aspergillus clavatus NRRL 1]|uniref:Oligopeptide transporter n=1 Tax=Aspergillus clavatus (strain ATCC 1007 / CBS 513.65 / DSM 816 / NCTC 3887 / NRRL 1 / QM 1276 / 107) TaxID=344612 RepID=A1CCL4_ASPCL|nr:oligopeptide transporter [Aspergillus clavatus NRRL 1]EAW12271.1 oligopeptide transporter [Aspergillus clavatus NRRL 1]
MSFLTHFPAQSVTFTYPSSNRSDNIMSQVPDHAGYPILQTPPTENDALLPRLSDDNEAIANERPLRRIPDSLPRSVWSIALVEVCDRFAFFGLAAPLQNYLQNAKDDPLRPGGLGLGQSYATLINLSFTVWCYVTPIFGAIIADQYLGRKATITHASRIYAVGLFILFGSSLSVFESSSVPILALLAAMLLIGIGAGGIRPNVNSLIAEQYQPAEQRVHKLDTGENVYVDYDMTIQRIFMIFIMLTNAGSLSSILTTTIEHRQGFPVAFLLPALTFTLITILSLSQNTYSSLPTTGSTTLHAFQAFYIAARNNWTLDAAKPSAENRHPWPETFIDELRHCLRASRIFLFYPIFWASYNQMLTSFISQAANMNTHGLPNDIMFAINPLSILLIIPVLDQVLLPRIRRVGLDLSPIIRITAGFFLCGLGMAYAGILQYSIYHSPPCYTSPRSVGCPDPNNVHIAWQAPVYIILAISEIFMSATGLEYAYSHAPGSMKSTIMALFLSTYTLGSLLSMLITPFLVDPLMTRAYAVLGIGTWGSGVVFWVYFGGKRGN